MRVLLLTLAVLALTAPLAGARGLRLHDDGRAIVADTDGRYVAKVESGLPGNPVRVLDTATWRWRTVSTPPGCSFTAVGGGTLLWNCGKGWTSGRTLDLRTGLVAELPEVVADPNSSEESGRYADVGARWTRVERGGYHYVVSRFADRVTGAEREPPAAANVVPDLDAPGLYRRLCTPLHRPLIDDGLSSSFAWELPVRDGMAVSFVYRDPYQTVTLQRCGRPDEVLRRCPPPACPADVQPLLAAGSVIWQEKQLRILSLRTRRTRLVRPGGIVVGAAGRRVFFRSGFELKHVTL